MRIRPARTEDLEQLLEIYNDAVVNSTASWDLEPWTPAEHAEWYATKAASAHPVIVARKVRDGEDATVDTSKITENENALYPDIWYPSGKAPDYWPDYFEDAVQNGMVDWYTGNLYKD